MENLRVPPQDTEAERAVLGSMLVDPDATLSAVGSLVKEDFYRQDNAIIFEAMKNIHTKSNPVDMITVVNELSAMNMLDKVRRPSYLASLQNGQITSGYIDSYIEIVKAKSTLRQLIKAGGEIVDLGFEPSSEVEEVMNKSEQKIFDILQKKTAKTYFELGDVLMTNFANLETLYNQTKPISGIASGFIDLDNKTAGLHNANYILIAARPAMGKTAFALNIASNVAIREKIPVAIFSLEMSKEELVSRIMCSEAKVDATKLRTGNLDDEDWAKLGDSLNSLSDAPIYIDDSADISINEIRTKCRKLKLEKGIGLIIVDYLQLVRRSGTRGYNREQEIAEISRTFKMIAKDLNIPVIALAQLSRQAEQRPDHRPMLSDLRESGSIEQDADLVMFLYRDDYYNKETLKKNIAEVIIAKHRAGQTGTIELLWFGKYTKFENLYKEPGEE